ncbi:LemA family protein [Candidatus Burarchaeum australiense]|nr:LemA family protein [Candidatus Burarchaeum australiense]
MIEWLILAVVVILVLLALYYYNRLTGLNNQAEADWKLIDPLLQQRLDTIPNLIAMAKRIMKQEMDLFNGIAKAREGAMNANTVPEKIAANKALGGMLLNFYARAEAYPQMRSNENMQTVMEQLASIEDKIKYGRQRYSYTVKDYKNATMMMPGVLFAGLFGFKSDKWPYYEADEGARKGIDAGKLLAE